MSTDSASTPVARVRARVHRWVRDTSGMAAIEFGMIVPIMAVMFIGAVELSQAIIVDRRVTAIAATTADLVARAETQISQSDITDIMRASSFIMAPYTRNQLQIVVRELQSSPASATIVKESWNCTYNGTGQTLVCNCMNASKTVPGNLVGTNDAVILAEVTYGYQPLVFDYFMKRNWGSTGTSYNLAESIYQKPRGQWPVLQQSNGTACPAPTFP
jgi:Flp pilus assembly protein TadG